MKPNVRDTLAPYSPWLISRKIILVHQRSFYVFVLSETKSNEELGVIWSRFCASNEGVVLVSAFERPVSKFSIDIFVFFAFIPSCRYLYLAWNLCAIFLLGKFMTKVLRILQVQIDTHVPMPGVPALLWLLLLLLQSQTLQCTTTLLHPLVAISIPHKEV